MSELEKLTKNQIIVSVLGWKVGAWEVDENDHRARHRYITIHTEEIEVFRFDPPTCVSVMAYEGERDGVMSSFEVFLRLDGIPKDATLEDDDAELFAFAILRAAHRRAVANQEWAEHVLPIIERSKVS